MIPFNDLSRGYKLYQKEYEEKALEILRSGCYILGKEVENFEKEFANSLGNNCYCASVCNGLNAITLGLEASGIKKGDEIIVQANGYIATILGIIRCGAIPIFIEPDEYYQLDFTSLLIILSAIRNRLNEIIYLLQFKLENFKLTSIKQKTYKIIINVIQKSNIYNVSDHNIEKQISQIFANPVLYLKSIYAQNTSIEDILFNKKSL